MHHKEKGILIHWVWTSWFYAIHWFHKMYRLSTHLM